MTGIPSGPAADLHLSDIITLRHGDAPRIADLRLAQALGMSDPHAIRRIIKAHAETLQSLGELLLQQGAKPQDSRFSDQDRKINADGRGRPGKTYYLTKQQALFVTAKSDTPAAAMVTVRMVAVFDAVTSGRIDAPAAAAPFQDHTLLNAAFRVAVDAEYHARVERVKQRVAQKLPDLIAELIDAEMVAEMYVPANRALLSATRR